jgi:hypothetical protein
MRFLFPTAPLKDKAMKNPGTPITWEEIEELGLEEVPPGYEPSEDEHQHDTDGREHDEGKE